MPLWTTTLPQVGKPTLTLGVAPVCFLSHLSGEFVLCPSLPSSGWQVFLPNPVPLGQCLFCGSKEGEDCSSVLILLVG